MSSSFSNSKIRDQNVASIIIKNEVSFDGDVQKSQADAHGSKSHPLPKGSGENTAETRRTYPVLKIWIRQNLFLYEFFRKLYSEMTQDEVKDGTVDMNLAELIASLKDRYGELRQDLFKRIENEHYEIRQLPSALNGEMRWNQINALTKAVVDSFHSKKVLSQGFTIDWARQKHVGWVDLFYLKICYRGDEVAQGHLHELEKSTLLPTQPKMEHHYFSTQLPFPYVSRPQLEQTVKQHTDSARLEGRFQP